MGACLLGHFPIDVLRADFKRRGFVGQIADFFQEGAVGSGIGCGSVLFVPVVYLLLDGIAFLQEGAVARREFSQEFRKALPKCLGLYVGAGREDLFGDETVEVVVDLQAGCGDIVVCHDKFSKILFL